jgi:ABC-type transport system involved in multi-copper enzyme maturation permease subunit
MSLVKTLFTENPMMVEITRFRRKFLGARGGSLNSVIFAMCAIIYVGIVALVWNYRDAADPLILVFLQTGILTLLAPALLHGAIAGERERRSWDFLLVAPVSHAQIVCGKFMGAAAALLACSAVFLLPIAIGVVFYEPSSWAYNSGFERRGSNVWPLIQAELLSVTWGLLVCAMTIFFSARCRRGFIALGTSLAFLVVGLIVWPILIGSAGLLGAEGFIFNFFHPFWAITQLESGGRNPDSISAGLYGLPQVFTYIGLTAVLLAWTERTLRFADNEVKFLPQKKDA